MSSSSGRSPHGRASTRFSRRFSRPRGPPDLDLIIAGDGKEASRVEQAMRESAAIRWLGSVPYAEVAALVSSSFAALVPMNGLPRSNYGLSPLKLFEAMASGVPVVASDLPGLGDLVREHDCGLTFPAGDRTPSPRRLAGCGPIPARHASRGERGRAAALRQLLLGCSGRSDRAGAAGGRGRSKVGGRYSPGLRPRSTAGSGRRAGPG